MPCSYWQATEARNVIRLEKEVVEFFYFLFSFFGGIFLIYIFCWVIFGGGFENAKTIDVMTS